MSGLKVFAPASVGNIGIGFDIMGLALERPGDSILVRFSQSPGLRITRITGDGGRLPLDPARNTAGAAALSLLAHLGASGRGIDMEIHKQMPMGSGLGSSAASAVAAVLAVSELLRSGLSKRELLPFAAEGERVASGGLVVDNIAPSLLGGIVLIRDAGSFDVHRLHVPRGLCVAVVHPHTEILTRDARAVLKPAVPMPDFIRQSANIGGFITGLFTSDMALIGRSLQDVVIEPQRAGLIPGFYAVKQTALDHGALGCSISGAGPSVFALFDNTLLAEQAGAAMQRAFKGVGLESTAYLSGVNPEGAYVC